MNAQMDSLSLNTQSQIPDILNEPETPLRVVQCYFLLRENEFHTLYRVSEILSKAGFTAEEIGAACKIYMEN